MELALALEEQAAARRASLQTACEYVMRQNSAKDAYNAGATVLAYIRAVLAQPRSRDCRRSPVDNAVFHDNVGRLPGGIAVMAALLSTAPCPAPPPMSMLVGAPSATAPASFTRRRSRRFPIKNSGSCGRALALLRLACSGVEPPQPAPFLDAVARMTSGRGGVTLGPPISRLIVPLAASTESLTSSAPSLLMSNLQSRSFKGSFSKHSSEGADDRR